MNENRRTWARRALAVVVVLGLAEILASIVAYRDTIAPRDWARLRAAVEADVDHPVIVGTAWLAPSVRQHLPAAAVRSSVARADLVGWPRFSVITLGEPPAWDPRDQDLGGQDPPTAERTREFGALRLTTFTFATPHRVVANIVTSPGLRVSTANGRCRGQGPWRCLQGRVRRTTMEIDYRPRRCLAIEVDHGIPVRLDHPKLQTGTRLRGHIGFGDFNGRLRSDAPARVVVWLDGDPVAQFVVTDAQGWRAFEVPTTPGRHDVSVEIQLGALGTWGSDGYSTTTARPACVELRSLEIQS